MTLPCAAKVCAAVGVPNPGIHGLWHGFASMFAHSGISKMISQEIGGWANERTVKEIYTHVYRLLGFQFPFCAE